MSDHTINLTPVVYEYLLNKSLRDHPVLKKLREETHKLDMGMMQISPEQGQFMVLLMELLDAKKTLDIGTFTGYSALAVALALPENGKVITCDTSEEWTEMARKFWEMAGVSQKIDLRLAPALETLQGLLDQGEANTFDFSFIDADKNNYLHYYELSYQLIRKGGLIAIDNVLRSGDVANPAHEDNRVKAIREMNNFVFTDERVTISMLPVGDGLTLARKR